MKKSGLDLEEIKKHRQKKRFFFKLGAVIFILGLLTFGGIRFFFYSSIFRIRQVVVSGDESNKEKILTFLRARIENGSFLTRSLGFNNFLAWPGNISGNELASISEVDNLIIKKQYSTKTLTIDVVDKKPFAIWCLKKNLPAKCFWFDPKGVVFKESPEASGNLVRVVSDYSQDQLIIGSKILKNEFVPNMISILETLSVSGLSLKEIVLHDLNLEEIDAQISGGPVIYFSLHYPASGYLSFIKKLSASPTFKNITYVDLRVLNHAYYK